ncbi:uncharacterized protein LOC135400924 isoform X2 [Ornithodoros turicata]|uniref:uncharacterized protein LOC135400924 isoform X2 n=1 Tax=Ornithodoros turicata TaxID=34597 RepID=UPI003138A6D0
MRSPRRVSENSPVMQEAEPIQRRSQQRAGEQATCKKLYRRSTIIDIKEMEGTPMPPPPDFSDEDANVPRVVNARPKEPVYQVVQKQKVPPAPPQRRESLQAPPGEDMLPPPPKEFLVSERDNSDPYEELDHFNPSHPRARATGIMSVLFQEPFYTDDPTEVEPSERPRKASATKENFLDASASTGSSSWKFCLPSVPRVAQKHIKSPLNPSTEGGYKEAPSHADESPVGTVTNSPPNRSSSSRKSYGQHDSGQPNYSVVTKPLTSQWKGKQKKTSPLESGLIETPSHVAECTDREKTLSPSGAPAKCDNAPSGDDYPGLYDSIQDNYSVATKSLIRPRKGKPTNHIAKFFDKGQFTELQEEGKHAIDSPRSPTLPDLPPQDYILDEMEERAMIEPASYDDPRLKELIAVLIEWINDELASQRIIVKDIEEDLYDGQVLQKLLEKLTEKRLDVVEVTQSEEGQKQKLHTIIECANRVLGLPKWGQQKWNVQSIHEKNIVSIIHLLVALARHFRAPVRLPENVVVKVVVVQKRDGILHPRTVQEELTSTYDDLGMRVERDAFDTLFDHAPDKLQVVKKSLMTFVNKHLNKINLEVTDLDNQTLQFQDGIYLVLLMGLLEGYFVPLYSFFPTPSSFDQKVHNVSFAFTLMQDAGLPKPKARPEDLVNADLKSTLRVLYNLFTRYKDT